jgi:hypothetical protein
MFFDAKVGSVKSLYPVDEVLVIIWYRGVVEVG